MAKSATSNLMTVADKLDSLYKLQTIDSKIDEIRRVRGELPMEVDDLEDIIAGLETRISKLQEETDGFTTDVTNNKLAIKEAQALLKKYNKQQGNVKNNREFDALTKEIELQTLEIELAKKKIKDAETSVENKAEYLKESKDILKDRSKELKAKKKELDSLIAETEKEEESLLKKSKKAKNSLEDRLVNAYERVRGAYKNGLAVVTVERQSCGGCYNKIPPQLQLEIRTRKKINTCEHCGRILVAVEE